MSIKREIAVIVVIGMGMCFLSVEGSSEFPICTESHAQFFPAVYEDIVVREDNRNGNWDICGYNLTTREEFQITDDSRDQKHPKIFKNIVIWEVEEEEYREYLYGYNLSTQEEFLIAKSSKINSSAIYGNIVVWENVWYREDPIRGFNLSTNQEFPVHTRNPFVLLAPRQHEPAIYGDILIWKEGRDDDNIYGYDLLTGKRFAIATAHAGTCDKPGSIVPEGSRRPAIYGDIVIWVDCRNGMKTSTGTTFQRRKNSKSPAARVASVLQHFTTLLLSGKMTEMATWTFMDVTSLHPLP